VIGICTDSNSQLPQSLAEKYAIEVVPVTVTVNEHDYLEGVDLDADEFYDMLAAVPPPVVSTSQPSPGQFRRGVRLVAAARCDEIISIHVTAATSGTLNAARLAARLLPLPVRLVDSGTAGFGVSCLSGLLVKRIARGATIDEAVQVAESLNPHIGAVFVVGQLTSSAVGDGLAGVPVMTVNSGRVDVVSRVDSVGDAVATMPPPRSLGDRDQRRDRHGDRTGTALTESLARVVGASANVLEVVRYRIGPSVGVYAGLGTVGLLHVPRCVAGSPSARTPSRASQLKKL
jgi:DegV family protein with EDD domain